ncbi:hypothetical protein LTR49_028199 [Elasticomyces elasticus]|nr:hypothetical protein LTR49_028199 [Elasticomyces elasticus]
MSFTSRPDSLDDCKIGADAPPQTQSIGIGTDQARIGDMGADRLSGGLTTMANFEQLESALQAALKPLKAGTLHVHMKIDNLRDRQINATASRPSDSINSLRVLCANGTIARPPSAEFPKDVWHFWKLPLKNLLALLQFYEIDGWRASDLSSIYLDGSNHRGSHSDSHSMHTAAVAASWDDARRALAREIGMDYDRVAKEMRVAQPAMAVAQQGTGRKRPRTAPEIAQPPHKKRKRCKGQALVKTTDQFMDAPVSGVMAVMPGKSALSSHTAAHTKLGWDATAEPCPKVKPTVIAVSSLHDGCEALHRSSNNSATESMVLSGSKRFKRRVSPPLSDTEPDTDKDAEAAIALARGGTQ